MLVNHVCAIKVHFTMLGLNDCLWDNLNVHYFQKSIKINPPFHFIKRNIIDSATLALLVDLCDTFYIRKYYKALFWLLSLFFVSIQCHTTLHCPF